LADREAHRMCRRAAPEVNDWSVSFPGCMGATPTGAAS
jgi:hypothetical protein